MIERDEVGETCYRTGETLILGTTPGTPRKIFWKQQDHRRVRQRIRRMRYKGGIARARCITSYSDATKGP